MQDLSGHHQDLEGEGSDQFLSKYVCPASKGGHLQGDRVRLITNPFLSLSQCHCPPGSRLVTRVATWYRADPGVDMGQLSGLEGQAPVVSLALDRQAEPVWLLARVSLSGIGWVSQQELCD